MKKYTFIKRYEAISRAKLMNNLLSEVGSGSVRSLDAEIFERKKLARKYIAHKPFNIYCPQCRLVTGRPITIARRKDLREHLLDHRIHRALGDEQAWIEHHVAEGSGRFRMHCREDKHP